MIGNRCPKELQRGNSQEVTQKTKKSIIEFKKGVEEAEEVVNIGEVEEVEEVVEEVHVLVLALEMKEFSSMCFILFWRLFRQVLYENFFQRTVPITGGRVEGTKGVHVGSRLLKRWLHDEMMF